jgi:NitT/TauT family transport system substrate-binding protein
MGMIVRNMGFMVHVFLVCMALLILATPCNVFSQDFRVGTWKTAQTIQPFFYDRFISKPQTVSVYSFTNPADQKLALLAGSLDMCGTTLAHAIHSASRDEPVVIVAALCNKCSALVVKRDGPIHTAADLRGNKIGYVPGTMHEILLRETLTKNNISPDSEVKLTRVDFFDMGIALARGSIDAFLSGEPFPTLAVVEGYGTVLSYPYYEESIGAINAGMLVTQETINENPEMVYQLVMAHALSTDFLISHEKIWLEKASTFGTRMEILEKAAPNMELAWYMDKAFVAKARALGQRMQSLGVIDRQPDYEKLFDLSFVKRVRKSIEAEQTSP